MLKRDRFVYTPSQVNLMWNNVTYRDCRRYAFYDGFRWQHPDVYFDTCEEFFDYLKKNQISDVHVKPLDDNGGREWVIDVDFDCDDEDLELKIRVSAECFKNFFKDNISRIVHSGNRGIHVWLRIDKFPMHASKQVRERYYKIFVPPLDLDCAPPEGSFAAAFVNTVNNLKSICGHKPLLHWWPRVDKHVFCNINSQIRVPYSFNFKGNKFSAPL
ncbi:lef-1 [Alphabaculovirus alterspexiguae]|uniref:Lef-1 n=1 Tax=Spodoptera exigua multiple nucleopolyhedrovirus TaxID=10454 RepID=A0A3G2JTW2_9ABAC|nr:lef-1 [Spodoptera exigua multiple nucleopolyhedrovirus]AYN44973.1 lef-1 [Spodoptera exigua multiple nucleopolyhedrovirus]